MPDRGTFFEMGDVEAHDQEERLAEEKQLRGYYPNLAPGIKPRDWTEPPWPLGGKQPRGRAGKQAKGSHASRVTP